MILLIRKAVNSFLEDMYGARDMTMNLREGWEGITPYHFLLTLTTQREENADRQFVVIAILRRMRPAPLTELWRNRNFYLRYPDNREKGG